MHAWSWEITTCIISSVVEKRKGLTGRRTFRDKLIDSTKSWQKIFIRWVYLFIGRVLAFFNKELTDDILMCRQDSNSRLIDLLVIALIHCAMQFGNNFGKERNYMIILDFIVYSIGDKSQYGDVLYHLKWHFLLKWSSIFL